MTGILNLLAGAVGVVKDTYFNLVTLLLPGNGTNGAQNNTFLDSSSNNFTITRNGNTTQGTFSPFSQTGWGTYFNGSSSLTVSGTSTACALPGDFTIEFWLNNSATTTYGNCFSTTASIDTANGLRISTGNGNNTLQVASALSGILNASTSFSNNVWIHVALVRSGTTITLYQNGVSVGSATNSQSFVSDTFYIGNATGTGSPYYLNGYISNFRVVKGSALYTGSFTPSTTPLTAITNTSLLTCQSNRFIDNSSNAFAITVNGTPSVQAFSPFAPTAAYSAATNGGSGYFDGTGDYLNYSPGSAFAFGTGDFTVEGWAYFSNATNEAFYFIDARNTGQTSNWAFLKDPDASVFWYDGVNSYKSGINTITQKNTWYHVAYTRSGTTGRIFINGVQTGGNFTDTTNYSTSVTTAYTGCRYNQIEFLTGYFGGIRVVKGTALYTSNFTPPTTPFTAVTNTSFLLNFTNAGITDATAKNVLETIGTAQISTTQSKFGGSSIYIPGTATNYVKCATSTNLFDIAGVDFTIEFWVRFDSLAANRSFVSKYGNSAETAGDLGYNLEWLQSTNQLRLVLGKGTGSGDALYTWSWTPSTNTWYHVAVTRSGTSGRAFVDGTQIGTTSTVITNDVASPNSVIIGKTHTTAQYMNGYIDDLRITRGYARYTANFSAPTAAFPLQ